MSGGRVLLVWRAIPNVTVQNNERRTALRLSECVQRLLDPTDIVGIADSENVPSVCKESARDVLREGQARVPLDRDVVVVVDPTKVVQAQMAGQRSGFRTHALHQATITTNGINVVIEHLEAGTIEVTGKPLLCDRHPNTRRDSLSQWTGCGFNAGHPVILGMAGRFAVELAKAPDVIECHRRLPHRFILRVHRLCAGQMKRRPEQH